MVINHGFPGAVEPPPKADPIGHKNRKKGWGFGRNRPRAYRRDAGYSIYLGFFVFFVAINSSRPASIFEDSHRGAAEGVGIWHPELGTRNNGIIVCRCWVAHPG